MKSTLIIIKTDLFKYIKFKSLKLIFITYTFLENITFKLYVKLKKINTNLENKKWDYFWRIEKWKK